MQGYYTATAIPRSITGHSISQPLKGHHKAWFNTGPCSHWGAETCWINKALISFLRLGLYPAECTEFFYYTFKSHRIISSCDQCYKTILWENLEGLISYNFMTNTNMTTELDGNVNTDFSGQLTKAVVWYKHWRGIIRQHCWVTVTSVQALPCRILFCIELINFDHSWGKCSEAASKRLWKGLKTFNSQFPAGWRKISVKKKLFPHSDFLTRKRRNQIFGWTIYKSGCWEQLEIPKQTHQTRNVQNSYQIF